ncbi:hemin uptake protein HemP [Rhodopseudomonas palustris]|uniref:Hemin uptake protein HemP n=1 Tax=Rhodopseudomonas palustris (strain ATCC BAA-98 / CGA009) TaxID=258594 RepID=Q6N7Y3_RHOPA|nr:hemin uptake protein HemP [Rhodopseudomonas palustris]2JRA_A Chain A, Protein RPA2121 [Rhodopseudomonas palustris CGA009]2JRA_B Chain B, Protein RPA2121 [Rhodopseudomonas palustris CGA009]OPF90598.1 hemin uptake protein HemP [Rhodopseudomonas palustris]PPQ43022.1 hemin uptake protein HemP [Rhodopseudomonas palustris]RJF61721.1 hemin uptake protein HemP [Rhodopseudomonas palustris]WAB79774.1 hemin uptake protein HemP [Rhodopseudomonas palustris]WCL92271.1 hemin uptake protein HemP [Rhodops
MMTASDRLGADPTQAASSPGGARAVSIVGNQIDSRELFTVDREIVIAHGDDRYRLRLTSQNKLILTK